MAAAASPWTYVVVPWAMGPVSSTCTGASLALVAALVAWPPLTPETHSETTDTGGVPNLVEHPERRSVRRQTV